MREWQLTATLGGLRRHWARCWHPCSTHKPAPMTPMRAELSPPFHTPPRSPIQITSSASSCSAASGFRCLLLNAPVGAVALLTLWVTTVQLAVGQGSSEAEGCHLNMRPRGFATWTCGRAGLPGSWRSCYDAHAPAWPTSTSVLFNALTTVPSKSSKSSQLGCHCGMPPSWPSTPRWSHLFDRCSTTLATRRPVCRRSIAHSPDAGLLSWPWRLAAAGARKQQLSSGSSSKPKPGKPPHLCGTPWWLLSSHDGQPSLHTPLCKHSQHPCSTSQPTALSVAMVSSHPLGQLLTQTPSTPTASSRLPE